VAAAVSVFVFCAALAEVAPLIGIVIVVLGLLARLPTRVMPAGVSAGGAQWIALMFVVAVAAPLLAYPLARWR